MTVCYGSGPIPQQSVDLRRQEAVEEVSPDLERLSTPRSRLRGDPGCGPLHPHCVGAPFPGPSALLACVLHEYACPGVPHPTKPTGFVGTPSRRPGRIRTTWPPDLSAPLITGLLVS